MIPKKVINSFIENNIPYKRNDTALKEAEIVLNKLGINSQNEIFEFYSSIYGCNIINPNSLGQMIDIADEEIFEILEYVQDRYSLSDKFIPLTSDESEGMYLYNKENYKVYDFSLKKY